MCIRAIIHPTRNFATVDFRYHSIARDPACRHADRTISSLNCLSVQRVVSEGSVSHLTD